MIFNSRKKHIILIGMPGSGKSTIGGLLSKRLNLPFVDMDEEFERITGDKINSFWANVGELGFRMIERLILMNLINGPQLILSSGGGCPIFMDNMHLIEQEASVYLKCSPQVLFDRVKGSNRSIYKAHESNLYEEINQLLSSRVQFYERAEAIFDASLEIESVLNNLYNHSFIISNL
ncbi:MAG: shikimate kinase [Saprospiraceae bacterium]